ncbi:hypothetical protein ACFPN1_16160 [Lysobacter yangpyeongensis]|uniref:Uncharacterized protein n=1 Tax=Lysobacter yangpyeongensis TaxID=346182 RepID=A0ABW0SS31_9GAMM
MSWMYTSHKYDCFNIGPCTGDIDYWINLDTAAFFCFLILWAALFVASLIHSKQAGLVRSSAYALLAAVLVPLGVLFSAHWLFNLGIVTAQV